MSRPDYYILDDDGIPVWVADAMTWAAWFESNVNARIVARYERGEYWVSTVFLGLDHNFWKDGPPILFETMVFGFDSEAMTCERYSTRDDALIGHERHVGELNRRIDAAAVIAADAVTKKHDT